MFDKYYQRLMHIVIIFLMIKSAKYRKQAQLKFFLFIFIKILSCATV